jgi:hypothetical protein
VRPALTPGRFKIVKRAARHVKITRSAAASGKLPATAGSCDHELVAYRRMRDPQFRQQQWDGRWAPHVAPINALVDELRDDPSGRGWAPYVSPDYGGVDARVLNIFRDPGPKTHRQHDGSGFLCVENDDASAERFATLQDGAGIAVGETLSWNAYPWYMTVGRVQPSWRPVSSRSGGSLVSFLGCGWSCCTEDQPRTAGNGSHDGILTWYPGSKWCPPSAPAIGHSSARPTSGQHAWQR